MSRTPAKRVNLTLPAADYAELQARCAADGVPISWRVADLVAKHLKRPAPKRDYRTGMTICKRDAAGKLLPIE